MSKEICEGVFLVGSSTATDPGDCMVYLVRTAGATVLIDTGTGRENERLLENIRKTGAKPEDISTIVLTHCHVDHIGGTNALREISGAKVYAHELDAAAIEDANPAFTVERYYGMKLDPIPVDMWLSGSEGGFDEFPELCWIHTPGHTPGSISIVFDSPGREKVLFGQDIHGPFEPGFGSDKGKWRESMNRLLELNADILCEGHFGVYRPAGEVRSFIESFLQRHSP